MGCRYHRWRTQSGGPNLTGQKIKLSIKSGKSADNVLNGNLAQYENNNSDSDTDEGIDEPVSMKDLFIRSQIVRCAPVEGYVATKHRYRYSENKYQRTEFRLPKLQFIDLMPPGMVPYPETLVLQLQNRILRHWVSKYGPYLEPVLWGWAPDTACPWMYPVRIKTSKKVLSSSTPTVPYSTADILYGSEVNARPPIEEVRQNSLDLERTKELSRIKSKELEQHPNNRRPNSKSASKKSLSIEAVTIEREKEDAVKGYSNTLPPTKPSNHFRPNGIRSNILKGEPMFSAKSNGALSGRDPDDLVAMGTLWSPNNQNQSQSAPTPPQQMSRSGIQNNVSSNAFPSKSNPSSSSVNPSMSASTTMTPQRKYTSNNVRPIVVQNNTISGIRNNLKEKEKEKDAEPKYSDPLIGAPASYQQRLIELGALEGDTVRWERTKRLKKKKQDRDS